MQPAPGVAAKSDWIDLDNSTSSFADNETTECYGRTASCSALQPARRLPSDRIATPHRPHGGRLGPAAGLWLLVMRHRCAAAAEVVDDSLSYAVGVILRYLVSSAAVPKHNRPSRAVAVYRLGILLDRLRDCCYPSPNLGCVLDALRSQLLRNHGTSVWQAASEQSQSGQTHVGMAFGWGQCGRSRRPGQSV